MRKLQKTNNQEGVTLLLAVLILAGLTLVTLAVADFAIQEIRASRAETESEPAITAAETAAENALWGLKRGNLSAIPDCTSGSTANQSFNSSSVKSTYCKTATSGTYSISSAAPVSVYLYDPSDINGDTDLTQYVYSTLTVTNQSATSTVTVNVYKVSDTTTPIAGTPVTVSANSNQIINLPSPAATQEGRMVVSLTTVAASPFSVNVNTNKGLPDNMELVASGCGSGGTLSSCSNSSNQELFSRSIKVSLKPGSISAGNPSPVPPGPPPPPPPPFSSQISASPSSIGAGGTETVTITNGPGNTTDWVGLYQSGAANSAYNDWKYLNGLQTIPTSGLNGASLSFVMPATLGSYEFRFFAAKNGNDYVLLATSNPVTVTSGTTISAVPSSIASGGSETVTVSGGPANTGDYVGLFATGAADGSPIPPTQFLNGSPTTQPATGLSNATLNFTMPTSLGTYEFRFFANNTLTKLATSSTVTVTDGSAPTVPTGLTATAVSSSQINLSWTASTDNVGVIGYKIFRGGLQVATSATNSYSDTGLTASTAYTYNVSAYDAAANNSAQSSSASATTQAPPDSTPPTVSITAPTAGATVSGTTTSVTANASDNVGVVGVQFKLDGVNLGSEDLITPYAITWNTTTATNASHSLTAVARDAAGNNTTSATVTVTVSNDTTAPTVSITAPTAGATVSGTTTSVTANASDNVGVVGVQFKLDGVNLGAEDLITPYAITWDTTTASNGSHSLTAVARDAAGNTTTTSPAISVTVSNDTTAPTVSITAPTTGATVSGTTTAVSANASDNVGVVGVQFKLDGVNLGAEATSSPYGITWDTTTASNGAHSLTAVARDAAGNTTTSSPAISVTVNNAGVTIARVAGQKTGKVIAAASTTIAYPGNVTAGNTLIIAAVGYQGTGTSVSITKTAGTSTTGAAVVDKTYTNGSYILNITRIPVTATGTATITVSKTGATWLFVAINEYSGMAASPVDGTPNQNTGTLAGPNYLETTTAMTTSLSGGLIVMLSTEASTTSFTYTLSDTPIFQAVTGTSQFTGVAQDKLTASTGPFTMTASPGSVGNTWPWYSIAVAYKHQ